MSKKYSATYVGRRFINGKLYQTFIRTDTKKTMAFTGIKQVYIGHIYECKAAAISTRPKQISEFSDDIVKDPKWEAADELAQHEAREVRRKKKVQSQFRNAQKPMLKAAAVAMLPLFEGLDFYESERLGKILGEYVYDKIQKQKGKK